MDAVCQVGELLRVVEDLDALGVGVVAHRERPGDGGGELPVSQAAQTKHPILKPSHQTLTCFTGFYANHQHDVGYYSLWEKSHSRDDVFKCRVLFL